MVKFYIEASAYGINGRPPCQTDYINFFDGIGSNAVSLNNLCKFENPGFITTSSEARVVFASTMRPRRPASRVGVKVYYYTFENGSKQ